jgi:hypothetical protein
MSENCIVEETALRIPQDYVLAAMRRNVALKKLRQAEADDLFWFYSYAQDNHLSLTDAGDALGVSGTDAWNIMMGRFPDYAQAVSMIRAKRRSAKGSEAEATGFVEPSTWRTVSQVCDYVAASRKPAFIFGESQIGKTECLERWKAMHNTGFVKVFAIPPAPTLGCVVYELAKMLNIPPRGYSAEIKSRIYGAVDGRHVLLIDEVHRAFEGTSQRHSIRIFEFLRSIYDTAQCGMVLSGTNVFKEQFESGPISTILGQFRRRGIVSVVLPPVTPREDLDMIASTFLLPPLRTDHTAEEIVTRMVSNSGIGQFITFLKSAQNVAEKLKKPISWQHFIAAYDLVQSLSKHKKGEK